MNAHELRLGNYILTNNEISFVIGIEGNLNSAKGDSMFEYDTLRTTVLSQGVNFFECFAPIPLTEDWLLKAGFEKVQGKYAVYNYYHISGLGEFPTYIDDDGKFRWFSTKLPNIYRIKYVHQLQNLIFALTQTELIIKP